MISIAMILFCCVMFIHLGLGEAICKTIHIDFILFKCVKCLTWWMILCYTLFNDYTLIESCFTAFLASYSALWFDLLLAKMSKIYEQEYGKLV